LVEHQLEAAGALACVHIDHEKKLDLDKSTEGNISTGAPHKVCRTRFAYMA
jgi:hypothetical protein